MITYNLEYTLYAFETDKGVWTLVGTEYNSKTKQTIDTFRNLSNRAEFKTWDRASVYDWYKNGLIKPVGDATHPLWFRSEFKRAGATENKKTSKVSRKKK